MRRSRGRRRGLSRGVQRHKISAKVSADDGDSDDEDEPKNWKNPFIQRRKLNKLLDKWSQDCFRAYSFICYNLCLVALVKGSDGRIQFASLWRRIIQIIIYTYICFTMIYKIFVSFHRVMTTGRLDFVTFLCVSAGLAQIVGICVSSSALFRPKLTMDVINSWVDMRAYIEILRNGRPLPSSLAASMQVIMTTVGTSFSIFGLALFSLYFTSVPIFTIDMLKAAGVCMPDSSLPQWLWRVVLLPAEFVQFGVPLAPYGYAAHVMILEVGVMREYINELR